jgi:hypothetical protein
MVSDIISTSFADRIAEARPRTTAWTAPLLAINLHAKMSSSWWAHDVHPAGMHCQGLLDKKQRQAKGLV